MVMSKMDNSKPMYLVGAVPAEWMKDDEDEIRRKLPSELMKGDSEDRIRRKLKTSATPCETAHPHQ
jgi:meiotically up-regulated gene 157 (Mug157) protein